MANASTYLSDAVLNHTLRNTTFTSPTQTYLALFTSDAGLDTNDSGIWTEVSGGDYARVTLSSTAFKAAVSGVTENDIDIIFPTATGDWGTITHVAIMDATTAGNVLIWLPLTLDKPITTGDSFRMLQNDLDLSMT